MTIAQMLASSTGGEASINCTGIVGAKHFLLVQAANVCSGIVGVGIKALTALAKIV